MNTAIIILLSFIFLIWFISRWLRLASSPDRHFLHQDEYDIPPVHDDPTADATSLHIAKPIHSDSEARLSS
jgi:hypothetical protein